MSLLTVWAFRDVSGKVHNLVKPQQTFSISSSCFRRSPDWDITAEKLITIKLSTKFWILSAF